MTSPEAKDSTSTSTLMLIAGKKLIPVTISRRKRKLALQCRYVPSLIEEFKCMRGAEWDPDTKAWVVTDTRRNWMQLELLQGQMPRELTRYELPIAPVTPRRDGGPCPCGAKNPKCPGCQGTGTFRSMAHQRSMLSFALTRRCGEFASEQGTGKTFVAVELMEHAAGLGFSDWWYVAPLKVTKAIELEFKKWACLIVPKLVYYDILHRELEARYQCPACEWTGPESRATNKETGEQRCPECKREGPTRLPDRPAPHGVIFDESSFLKSSGAKRTEAAQHLADAVRAEHDGFVIEMSGTPAPKDPTDWHAQGEIAQPGYLRESTRAHLMRRLAIIEKGETVEGRAFPKVVGWRMDEVALLYQRLKGLVEIHLAKDCLDLPECRHELVRLPVAEDVKRAARLIAQTSVNAVQTLNRLRQLSDGFQYGAVKPCPECQGAQDDDPEDGRLAVECPGCSGSRFVTTESVRAPCPKDDALRDWLGRAEEVGRIVVYAGYHESVDRAVDVCLGEGWAVLRCDGRGWLGVSREHDLPSEPTALLPEMDAGTRTDGVERLAFVAHPGSGGYGLNLTAATINAFYSNDYNAASRWQAEKRSHRTGQSRGVTIVDFCHLGTDELILKNLAQKKTLQSVTLGEIVEALS